MVWPKDHKNEKIYYGLVHPTASWDVAYVYGGHLRDIFRRAAKFERVGDKVSAFLKGPGWEPGKPRLGYLEDIPEVPENPDPYDKQSSSIVYIYCFMHVAVAFVTSNIVVTQHMQHESTLIEQLLAYMFVLWSVIDLGYLLEHKWYAPALEWMRCALFFVVEWLLPSVYAPFDGYLLAVKVLFGLCFVFWSFNLGYYPKEIDLKQE